MTQGHARLLIQAEIRVEPESPTVPWRDRAEVLHNRRLRCVGQRVDAPDVHFGVFMHSHHRIVSLHRPEHDLAARIGVNRAGRPHVVSGFRITRQRQHRTVVGVKTSRAAHADLAGNADVAVGNRERMITAPVFPGPSKLVLHAQLMGLDFPSLAFEIHQDVTAEPYLIVLRRKCGRMRVRIGMAVHPTRRPVVEICRIGPLL